MRLSDLRDKKIRTLEGKVVGRVHEVHCDKGQVTALMCGLGSLIERWTGKREGHRIPWASVVKVDRDGVVIAPDPPRKASAGASRSRKGTQRPSAPRSRR